MTWYDRADVYDLWFDWDPRKERDFVLGASERWGRSDPRRVLEPFCGSGRLLRALPGRIVVGLDINRAMLRIAARRSRVFRADAARFAVQPGSFDLAFCLIDSFRHLLTGEEAARHLRAVARALRPGAVYVVGLDVTGDLAGGDVAVEEWSSERDGLRAAGTVRGLGDCDPGTRIETYHVCVDVTGAAGTERIESFVPMRAYSRRQLEDLIDGEGSFEIAAVFGSRGYDLEHAVELDEVEGSAVLVLRKPWPAPFAARSVFRG